MQAAREAAEVFLGASELKLGAGDTLSRALPGG
jgi:hypothetical protein